MILGPRLMPPYPREPAGDGFRWRWDGAAWDWVRREVWWKGWPKFPPEWGGTLPDDRK